jgi:hypothetical protein
MVGFLSKAYLNELIAKGSFSRYVNLLLLIKDWNNLMDINNRLWQYRGTDVETVTRNWVISLVNSIHVVGLSGEDINLLLIGPGLFHSTFKVRGGLVADTKEITGMVLSPHLLELIGSARQEYRGETDLVLNEHVAELPFSIIDKPLSVQEYERGVLAMKVFTPFKDAFKELDARCSDTSAYPKQHGLKILSSHVEFMNRMLVGKELEELAKRKVSKYTDPPEIRQLVSSAREYMMLTPGAIISPGFDELFLTRFIIQGLTAGYTTDSSQSLRTVDEIKKQVLEKEIPQIRENYCKIRTSISGGLF